MNIQAIQAKLAGKINTVVTKNFSANGKHKGALSYTQKGGAQRFCLESNQLTFVNGAMYQDTRTGFATLPAQLYSLLEDVITVGDDWNQLMTALGFKPVAVYFQKSHTPFYAGQAPVKYVDQATKALVNAVDADGREFYRSPVVREIGTYGDCWGTVVTDSNGKTKFIRTDNRAMEEVASVEEMRESETAVKDPETIA
jgi:hypothetical protein